MGDLSSPFQRKEKKESKNRALLASLGTSSRKRCIQVKTEMKHKVGKEPGGGNKKRKEVGNESPLQLGLVRQRMLNLHQSENET